MDRLFKRSTQAEQTRRLRARTDALAKAVFGTEAEQMERLYDALFAGDMQDVKAFYSPGLISSICQQAAREHYKSKETTMKRLNYADLTPAERSRFDAFKLQPWQRAVLLAAERLAQVSVSDRSMTIRQPRRSGKSLLKEYMAVLGIDFVHFLGNVGERDTATSSKDLADYYAMFGIARRSVAYLVDEAIRDYNRQNYHVSANTLYIDGHSLNELEQESYRRGGCVLALTSYNGLDIVPVVSHGEEYIHVTRREL